MRYGVIAHMADKCQLSGTSCFLHQKSKSGVATVDVRYSRAHLCRPPSQRSSPVNVDTCIFETRTFRFDTRVKTKPRHGTRGREGWGGGGACLSQHYKYIRYPSSTKAITICKLLPTPAPGDWRLVQTCIASRTFRDGMHIYHIRCT